MIQVSKLTLGRVLTTRGVMQAMSGLKIDGSDWDAVGWLTNCLTRHRTGDWGNVCPEDAALNDEALVTGKRIVSCYMAPSDCQFAKVWIITEADRSATTVLLPEEY